MVKTQKSSSLWKGASSEHYIISKKSISQIVVQDFPTVLAYWFYGCLFQWSYSGVTLGSVEDGMVVVVASSEHSKSSGKYLSCPTLTDGLDFFG